jgi:phosphatidate phosphatase PAH1
MHLWALFGLVALLLVMFGIGCVAAIPSEKTAQPPRETTIMRPPTKHADLQELPKGKWNHVRSRLLAEATPNHSAQDVLTTSGDGIVIPGKFSYSFFSKDLEDEVVEVWLDDKAGNYTMLGEATTDSDGRIAFALADGLPYGEYNFYLRVKGDGSATRMTLRVMSPGTKLMVFDIDATLTTSDNELFKDLVDDLYQPIYEGDYNPVARAGAREITHLRANQGYVLVYLTGRPYWLARRSRQWLKEQGMAPGTLHTTDSNRDILPTEGSVGDFKSAYLQALVAEGFEIHSAYGNASTDIYAYENAGINKARTFIVGDKGGMGGTVALGADYQEHVRRIPQ